jgi:hypothetical protein
MVDSKENIFLSLEEEFPPIANPLKLTLALEAINSKIPS